ncbi:uncharacterized protein [Ambystoma mexicanum]|uniref:uncharacterized protein n=1 Tax=Ambystoma mexicanum TaxID=8296 RepID=UPI0037E979E5
MESIQYVDDLLLCSDTEKQCRKDSIRLMTVLAEKGYKADKEKLKYCQEEVLYIGQLISQEGRQVTPERAETIMKTPQPKTMRKMQQFLGICNYIRAWVFEYSTYVKPLLKGLNEAQENDSNTAWTGEMTEAFDKLKGAICTALVLVIPDYST